MHIKQGGRVGVWESLYLPSTSASGEESDAVGIKSKLLSLRPTTILEIQWEMPHSLSLYSNKVTELFCLFSGHNPLASWINFPNNGVQ